MALIRSSSAILADLKGLGGKRDRPAPVVVRNTVLTPHQARYLAMAESGMSYAEMATEAGVTQSTIGATLMRARQKVIAQTTGRAYVDKRWAGSCRSAVTPDQARTLWLKSQGRSRSEVARVMGLSAGAVSCQLTRARRKLGVETFPEAFATARARGLFDQFETEAAA